jgi:hypothetical protein
MFRHTVLFTWKPEATPEQVEQLTAELRKMASGLPVVRAYACGTDAGVTEGNFDYAVTADFDDQASWRIYRDDPVHRDIIERLITPIKAERAAVQYEF